jgi:putative DNA primase/helicase
MEYQNLGDVATQLRSAGLMLDSVRKTQGGVLAGEVYVESARSVRCDVEGETKKQSGAYWLHELRLPDGIWITGAYWVDHGNSKYKIELRKVCAKCGADMPIGSELCPAAGCGSKKAKAREIPQEQLDAHRKRMAEARRQAEEAAAADAEVAASWANAVWLASREIFSPAEHDYLMRKKLKSAHGARVFESNEGVTLEGAEKRHYEYLSRFHGALVVPMLDKQGRRRGLQFILSRQKHGDLISKQGRDKEYWPRGMLKTGLHYVIGGGMHGIGLVAEGFATAASLAEASNLPVAVAFDAGNVGTVGEQIWLGSKKRIKLLYAADDDWLQHCIVCKKPTPVAVAACRHCGQAHGKGNAGVDKARLAAEATAGAWLAPVFSTERSAERKGPTDFNDLRCLEGEQIVAAQVAGKLEAIEWRLPPSAGGGSGPIRGAGEKQLAMLSPEEVAGRFSPVWSTDDVYYFDHRERVVCAKASLASAGGGGAGGVIYQSNVNISAGIYPITIGNGGTAVAGTGNNGQNSTFNGLTAIGGGGGGNGGSSTPGISGGSGGGSSFNNNSNTPGLGILGQGNSGGL